MNKVDVVEFLKTLFPDAEVLCKISQDDKDLEPYNFVEKHPENFLYVDSRDFIPALQARLDKFLEKHDADLLKELEELKKTFEFMKSSLLETVEEQRKTIELLKAGVKEGE